MLASASMRIAGSLSGLLGDSSGAAWWFPTRASTHAPTVDFWFDFILYVSLFFFVLIVGLMFYFMAKYRRRPGVPAGGPTHNTPMELTWTIIPTLLVIPMFWGGFKSYVDMATPPENAYEVQVTGQQWVWSFAYPNGHQDSDLYVPVNTPVRLVLNSVDVIHSVYIPAFRVKMDAVPGRFTKLWFNATRPGVFQLFCTEYCGTNHSDMLAKVHVLPAGEFEEWLKKADPFRPSNMTDEQFEQYKADPEKFIRAHPDTKNLLPPLEMGKKLYQKKGCNQCHSIEGKIVIGPAWNGIWGAQHEMADGSTVTVDENYVRESVLNPLAKIVKGFPGSMPTYQGRINDREIYAIIQYIKSLNAEKK